MAKNAGLGATVAAMVPRHLTAFIMKKSRSTDIQVTSARKAASRQSLMPQGSRPSRATDDRYTRFELTPLPALTIIEPVPPGRAGDMRRVRFGYFEPSVRDVHLVGSFNGWNPHATPMRRDACGDWSVQIDLPTGEHRYRFLVDGEWRDDPAAQRTAPNPFGGLDAVVVVT
jgi:hypothetical protein